MWQNDLKSSDIQDIGQKVEIIHERLSFNKRQLNPMFPSFLQIRTENLSRLRVKKDYALSTSDIVCSIQYDSKWRLVFSWMVLLYKTSRKIVQIYKTNRLFSIKPVVSLVLGQNHHYIILLWWFIQHESCVYVSVTQNWTSFSNIPKWHKTKNQIKLTFSTDTFRLNRLFHEWTWIQFEQREQRKIIKDYL